MKDLFNPTIKWEEDRSVQKADECPDKETDEADTGPCRKGSNLTDFSVGDCLDLMMIDLFVFLFILEMQNKYLPRLASSGHLRPHLKPYPRPTLRNQFRPQFRFHLIHHLTPHLRHHLRHHPKPHLRPHLWPYPKPAFRPHFILHFILHLRPHLRPHSRPHFRPQFWSLRECIEVRVSSEKYLWYARGEEWHILWSHISCVSSPLICQTIFTWPGTFSTQCVGHTQRGQRMTL